MLEMTTKPEPAIIENTKSSKLLTSSISNCKIKNKI